MLLIMNFLRCQMFPTPREHHMQAHVVLQCLQPHILSQAHKEDHQHFERRCAICKEWTGRDHLCYIQSKQAKPIIPEDKIKTFDFEWDISQNGIHVQNLLLYATDPRSRTLMSTPIQVI